MRHRTRVAGPPSNIANERRDECRAFATILCDMLRMARLPVTRENVLNLLAGMPVDEPWLEDSLLYSCLLAIPAEQAKRVTAFLHTRVAPLRPTDGVLLIDAVRGAVEGLSLDTELPFAAEIQEQR